MESADIIALDREDSPVLMVEIRAGIDSRDAVETFVRRMGVEWPSVPFGMFVDLETIFVFESSASGSLTLKTADVLGCYDGEFRGAGELKRGSRGILRDYLRTLVGAWLHDLDYRWKLKSPPALKELEEIGLVRRLEGGSTLREVPLALALR